MSLSWISELQDSEVLLPEATQPVAVYYGGPEMLVHPLTISNQKIGQDTSNNCVAHTYAPWGRQTSGQAAPMRTASAVKDEPGGAVCRAWVPTGPHFCEGRWLATWTSAFPALAPQCGSGQALNKELRNVLRPCFLSPSAVEGWICNSGPSPGWTLALPEECAQPMDAGAPSQTSPSDVGEGWDPSTVL